MKALSVVVLNFRTPGESARALESVKSTVGESPVEMIAVDNASNDGSSENMRRLLPSAQVIELPSNLGFAAGMNAGLRAATGDLILLLNSDIEALPDSIELLAKFLEDNPTVGLAAPMLVDATGGQSRTLLLGPTVPRVLLPWVDKTQYKRRRAMIGSEPLMVEATEGAAVMVKREVVDKVGGFDEDFFFYHEIVDWCLRIRDAGFQVAVVPGAKMVHLCGGSSGGVRRGAGIELKRSGYQLITKRLGRGVCAVVRARDAVSETLSVCFYGLLTALTLGAWRRGRDKFAVHSAVLRWIIAGMPDRRDLWYTRAFGDWDAPADQGVAK